MPSEQPPTRVESGTSIEEAERLAAIETDAVFGPAQPQPREGTQERYPQERQQRREPPPMPETARVEPQEGNR